jgi:hypothetical protein
MGFTTQVTSDLKAKRIGQEFQKESDGMGEENKTKFRNFRRKKKEKKRQIGTRAENNQG